jgi:HSP20 family protein
MLLRFDPTRPAAAFLPFDAVRTEHEVVVTMDVPGIDPSTIEVTVDRNVLTVATERPGLTLREGERVLAAERGRGRQVRRLTLGDTVDAGAITAEVDRGVLTLHLPVAEAARPRRIEVATPTPVAVAAPSEVAAHEVTGDGEVQAA